MSEVKNRLQPGDLLHGFKVVKVEEVPDVRSTAIELEHEKSGARLLHLLADDPENLFAVAFRTPPPDDTGLPHILEHTVLCGSQKFPVKDPFVELLKTSLASFLNAMTYPDKTVYPCASLNKNDYFNLARVYCDAAFKPLITRMHFKQEGHHYEFKNPGDITSELTVNGIVYNEMKGAYSNLDGVIDREEMRRICPDNAYGLDSGGDPDVIPTLSYEDFVAFHKNYYHPSNAMIFIYGDIPTEQHLEFLDKQYLLGYDRIEIDSSISEQVRWSKSREAEIPYPAGPEDDIETKSAVTISWLTNDVTDAITTLAMNIIESYLLSNAASPLRKALIDSKLGEELTSSGYADFQRDTFFTVGLKGTSPKKAKEIEELVREVCCAEADKGFDAEMIDAAFHRHEMSALEIRPQYPLRLMDRVYCSWLYEADPTHHLKLASHLKELRERYKAEPKFLEKILLSQIVDNLHQLTLTFVPDADYNKRSAESFARKMASVKAEMNTEELEQIALEQKELDTMQVTPNSPEALATLPRLSLTDIPKQPLEPPVTSEQINGCTFFKSGIFSGGLDYLTLAFDLSDFDLELLKYLPLYSEVVTGMGAAGLDYAAFARKEAACTGGVSTAIDSAGLIDNPHRVMPIMQFAVRGLERNNAKMLEVLEQRIFEPDFTDFERMADVIKQQSVQMRSGMIPKGNAYSSLYASRGLNMNCYLKEIFGGFSVIRLFGQNTKNFQPEILLEKFTEIHKKLTSKKRLTASAGGSQASVANIAKWLEKITAQMGSDEIIVKNYEMADSGAKMVGMATPADVAFVARAFPSVSATHELAPALSIISLNLSFGYLWNEVRVRRGAYGCRASHNGTGGLFGFSSYRDPCINETAAVYDGAFDYILKEMDLSAPAIEQAIIGTIKTLDIPWRPAQAVSSALSRYLAGSSYESRKIFRERLLTTSDKEIRRAVEEVLVPASIDASCCVFSSRQKLEAAVEKGMELEISEI